MTTIAVAPATGTSPRRRARRVLAGLAVLLTLLLVVAGATLAWARWELGRSLPDIDGERPLAGLSAPVTVERDALGVPTITGVSRVDVARALGFVHAQERFFQMDLSRRRAAGELAELLGPGALPTDRASRLHRFRARAARVVAVADQEDRAIVDAYTGGVNAGLAAMPAAPFEYVLLRGTPAPWRPEDTVLVLVSMFFSLQDANGNVEARAALLRDVFPAPLADFLYSTASDWDTPLDGDRLPAAVPPPAAVFDLRAMPRPRAAARPPSPTHTSPPRDGVGPDTLAALFAPDDDGEFVRGSNNWAVAGSVTADGRAILANDMHLGIAVPNTWFRASLAWKAADGPHRVTGVTLPGVPSIVVGSNGAVAWGFTNTTADWTDRVLVEPLDEDATRYRTPEGPRAFEIVPEQIRVKGRTDEVLQVRDTIWGPVAAPDHRGRLFAIAWVAHRPEALNLRLSHMEKVRTVEEAFEVANTAGIPGQNCVVADAAGNIGWTVAGRIPRRVGFDGRLPTSWADGSRSWNGWYAPAEYPRILNPPSGRIVTANNRLVGGRMLEMLGDGGYDPGARARQIRDDLLAIDRARVRDMLPVHLDDRALMMDRWRGLALGVLSPEAVAASAPRREFRRLLLEGWTGRASVNSVGYRLARQFRVKAGELAFAPFVARARALDGDFPATPGRALEGPVWALLTEQPPHLLDPTYPHWNALLLDAIDQTVTALTQDGQRLDQRTWGEANTSLVQHPLSRSLPWLSRWLDMPRHQLPGDGHMPRVQGTGSGASERLAVSPGHEDEGYFHMPGGQSGNPLSPHYGDGHEAWVLGEPTPFLPGPAVSRLVLRQ